MSQVAWFSKTTNPILIICLYIFNTTPFCKQYLTDFETTPRTKHFVLPLQHYRNKIFQAALEIQYSTKPFSIVITVFITKATIIWAVFVESLISHIKIFTLYCSSHVKVLVAYYRITEVNAQCTHRSKVQRLLGSLRPHAYWDHKLLAIPRLKLADKHLYF